MREIYPGIFMVTEKGRLGGLRPPVNLYVITGKRGLLFDAGYGKRSDIDFFVREFNSIGDVCRSRGSGFNVDRVLPSHMHPDHFSGLAKIRERLGLSVVLTDKMARLISSRQGYIASYDNERLFTDSWSNPLYTKYVVPLIKKAGDRFYGMLYGMDFLAEPDAIIDEDCAIEINGEKWRVFPSPGHAGEHISLYDPRRGILFAGDNVLRSITPWLGPPKSDLEAYLDSLNFILALPRLELILAAHGSPVADPKKRIREIIKWRIERLDQVRMIVKKYGSMGVTLKNIVSEIYPGVNLVKHMMARGWVELSLQYLVEKGEIDGVQTRRAFKYVHRL